MVIEILFSELCNLYGDLANIKYLEKFVDAKYVYTSINDKPYFIDNDVSLIYMGSMTESSQELVVEKLKKYKKEIEVSIEKGTNFLITGNAVEIFCKKISDRDRVIECLNIFNYKIKRNMMNRYNTFILGRYKDIQMVGFKSQFTEMYGDNSREYFIKIDRGIGINKEVKFEGIKRNNFIGTYLLGPILILNPYFTKMLLKSIGYEEPLLYEDELLLAYYQRLDEFCDMKRSVY